MTLPASPPISLNQICTEFGAPIGTPLGSFLRGGAWVPNTAGNAAVPTTLPISMLSLLGAAATVPPALNLAAHDLSSSRGVGTAEVKYRFNAAGTIETLEAPAGFVAQAGEWLLSGSASAYDVRVTGAVPTSFIGLTVGAWQNAAGTWTATLNKASVGTATDSFTVELRPAGGGATIASAVVDLYAERF